MNDTPVDLGQLKSWLRKIDDVSNKYDAYSFLKSVASAHAYSYFSILDVSREHPARLTDLVVISSLPDSFYKEYDLGHFLNGGLIVPSMYRTARPRIWSIEDALSRRPAGDRQTLNTLLSQYGMRTGVMLPVADAAGKRSVITFTGDRVPAEAHELSHLMLIATYLLQRLSEIAEPAKPNPGLKISERERQCLMWTAAGKTSNEIAQILGLSEHTVNQYISAVSQKLGSVNRTQAVAKAMRLRLID